MLNALQIFIRPEIGRLKPQVQFYEFPDMTSLNDGRAVAGKGDAFPLQIRSSTWIYDINLAKGKQQSLPRLPVSDATCLVYLFNGQLLVNDNLNIQQGESMVVENEDIRLKAIEDCNIVLFVTDRNARVFKEGMYSGNINKSK